MSPAFIISITLEPWRVRHLRAVSRAHLTEWGLAALTDTMEVLVSEIAGNAVRHTCSDRITLSLSVADGVVRLEVDDNTEGHPQLRHPGPEEESGRGLLIVDALATDWGTSEDGSATWCTLAA
ncbi:ATP-binding protein [Streptomyces spiralis]